MTCLGPLNSQNLVKGTVVNNASERPIPNVFIRIKNTVMTAKTDINGRFVIQNIKEGAYTLEINGNGFEPQNFPIVLSQNTIDLGVILLFEDYFQAQDLSIITITDDELNADSNAADNISGLLQASKDIFLRTAAFQFSASFFRIRGLDSRHGKVLMNGIEMNKTYDGRAQWSDWGGLNDVLRNQEFSNGLAASTFTFGGVLGTTNMDTRASK